MSDKPSAAHGDVRKSSGLSPRDRSLITVANLVALRRTRELPFHLKEAIENGVSREELIEVIAFSAFSRRPAADPTDDAIHAPVDRVIAKV